MMMTLRYSRWDQKRREPLVRSSPSCITTNRHAFACPLALGPSLSLNLCARSSVAKNNRVIIRVPCCDILGTGTHQNKNELKPHNFFQVVLPCLPRNLNNCIWWFDLARATRLHSSLSLSFFSYLFLKHDEIIISSKESFDGSKLCVILDDWFGNCWTPPDATHRSLLPSAPSFLSFTADYIRGHYFHFLRVVPPTRTNNKNETWKMVRFFLLLLLLLLLSSSGACFILFECLMALIR